MRLPPRPLIAAALGLLGLAFAALPAGAHEERYVHTMSWVDDDPNDSPGPKEERLFGVDFVAAKATFDDKVARWYVEMRHEASGQKSSCDKSGPWGTELSFRCNWDTTRLGDMTSLAKDQSLASGPLAPNGRYVITVKAWNVGRPQGVFSSERIAEEHVLPTRTVIVENPVSPPTGVSRSYDSNTGRVTVTWAPSPEPDIDKYIIQEKKNSGAWENVAERPHGATSFERQIPDVGTYQYQVAAVRPEVPRSGFSGTDPLEVASPPPPPPSEAPAEAPGPEPGVTVLEPPTTSTTVHAGAVAPGGTRPPAGGGSSLFARPSVGSLPRPSAPKTTPTTIDTGYSAELPYNTAPKTQNGVLDDPEELAGGEAPQSITKLITVPNPRDPRSLLVPMAGGLTIFVFAMQMTYVVRRRPALAQVDDDFGDWTGL